MFLSGVRSSPGYNEQPVPSPSAFLGTGPTSSGRKWTRGSSLTKAYQTEATTPGSAAFPAKIRNHVQAAVMEVDPARERLTRSLALAGCYPLGATSLMEIPSRSASSLVVSTRYLATSGRVRRDAYPQSGRHINIHEYLPSRSRIISPLACSRRADAQEGR